jgi:hypothetical protein
MGSPPASTVWETRNAVVASVLAPLLVLTGALGFALPACWALLSGAPAYNLFHGVAGMVGVRLVIRFGGRGAVASTWGSGSSTSTRRWPARSASFRPLSSPIGRSTTSYTLSWA